VVRRARSAAGSLADGSPAVSYFGEYFKPPNKTEHLGLMLAVDDLGAGGELCIEDTEGCEVACLRRMKMSEPAGRPLSPIINLGEPLSQVLIGELLAFYLQAGTFSSQLL